MPTPAHTRAGAAAAGRARKQEYGRRVPLHSALAAPDTATSSLSRAASVIGLCVEASEDVLATSAKISQVLIAAHPSSNS